MFVFRCIMKIYHDLFHGVFYYVSLQTVYMSSHCDVIGSEWKLHHAGFRGEAFV